VLLLDKILMRFFDW